jgi:hypothetical protein
MQAKVFSGEMSAAYFFFPLNIDLNIFWIDVNIVLYLWYDVSIV